MKHIWKVTVRFQEDIEGESCDDWDVFNVEAANDVDARKEGIKCAKQKYNENIQVQYAEIEHVLEVDN